MNVIFTSPICGQEVALGKKVISAYRFPYPASTKLNLLLLHLSVLSNKFAASLLYNNGASVSLYGIFTWCKENARKEQENRVIKRKKN